MGDHAEIGWWIAILFFSLFLSGIEITYNAGGKLQYIVGSSSSRVFRFMSDTIFSRFRRFQAALMVGRIILLVLFFCFTIPFFYNLSFGEQFDNPAKTVLIIVTVTLLLLLANEFLPRFFFGKRPDFWAKLFLAPAFLSYIFLYPFAVLFITFSKGILWLFGVSLRGLLIDDLVYRADIESVEVKNREGTKDETEVDSEVKIFRNALDFSSKKVRDCMVPRADIVAVPLDTGLDKLKDRFVETGISRILVFKENLDNIMGYIHMWEIFNNPQDWTNNLATISFVPESMQANRLMSDLMQHRKSIAVVVDEFGSTSGLVTMEDLVEEIFGDIEDEYDVESKFVKREGENGFVMSGRVEIDHLNDLFHLDIPESDDYSTVAGYLLFHLQRFPKTYETIIIGKYTFKILKVTARKIEVVRLLTEGEENNVTDL